MKRLPLLKASKCCSKRGLVPTINNRHIYSHCVANSSAPYHNTPVINTLLQVDQQQQYKQEQYKQQPQPQQQGEQQGNNGSNKNNSSSFIKPLFMWGSAALGVTVAYIIYDQWRSIQAGYTMYRISKLYSDFNDKYADRMNQVTHRRFASDNGSNDNASSNSENNELTAMSHEQREAQIIEDEAFMDFYASERRMVHQQCADLMLHLCRTNKGAYVKAGQYLASLSYILPREYTDTLSVLMDRAPTHTYEETVQIFKEEFGVDPNTMFSSFDMEPIASASIAQVHVAHLKDTNEKVAVKIQHPGLSEMFKADLRAMGWIMFAYKLKNKFSLDWLLPEFERVLQSELDFMNEAKNCERLRDMFADTDSITAPQLYWDKITKRVLVMEFIDGCKITDYKQMEKMGVSSQEMAQLLMNSFSRQTFEHGFIHSDLHSGNIFVRYNQKLKKAQLVYLDHGCYEELNEKTRIDYASLWKSIVFRDHEDMKHFTGELGIDSEFYLLFAMFLSAANILDSNQNAMLDNRRQKNMSKAEWKHVVKRLREKYLVNGRNSMDSIIEDMIDQNSTNKSLVLLLRANAQVRNLIFDMNASVNRFGTMAEYCIRAVHTKMRSHEQIIENHTKRSIVIPVKRQKLKSLFEKLSMNTELLRLRFRLMMLNVFIWLSQNFSVRWFGL